MNPEVSKLTLDHLFWALVEKHSELPALAFVGKEPFTYAELGQRVKNTQNKLRQLGLKKQDKVIILGPSSPNWGIAFLAVMTMGAVAVPVMDEFPEADVEYIINHSDAVAVFISEYHYNDMNLPSLDSIGAIFNLTDTDISMFKNEPIKGNRWAPFSDRRRSPADKQAQTNGDSEDVEIEEDDLAQILYTSGTTGHSKGVMLTHKNLVSNVIAAPKRVPELRRGTVVLSFLPLAHAFGSTGAFLTVIYVGGEIYYLNRKPSPKVLMSAMQKVKPTFIASVPLVFEKVYQKQVVPKIAGNRLLRALVKVPAARKILYRLIGKKIMEALGGRLECVVIGGASLTHDVEVFMREGKIPYVVGYGMSECSPYISAASLQDGKLSAVGYAFEYISIDIDEPDPETGIGEIMVKGPNVMRGYYKNETETKNVLSEDQWLRTGDRGYFDKDGFLFIKGRSKNVIIGRSGENIYPEAIESKLQGSPFVEETLVYELDNQVVARIYLDYNYIQQQEKNKDDETIAADIENILEQIRQETNTQLPAYSKIQKIMEQRSPFIKTPSNKIKRVEYVPNFGKDRV